MNKKRLFFDIETSPNVGFFWSSGYKISVPYNHIIQERAAICICYKWAGDKKVHSLTWDKNNDDKEMLKKFIEIANEADELVGHNGDKFDLAFIRTRCLYHGIPMFPSYVTIDTLKSARSKFKFNSNRLDYIAKFLGFGEKLHTEFNMWKGIVLDKDKEALNKMVEYCKHDVVLLEKIYDKMEIHLAPKVHYGMIEGKEKYSCSNCGSMDLKYAKTRYSAAGTKRIQLQCNNCNRYNTISESTYNKYLSSNSTT